MSVVDEAKIERIIELVDEMLREDGGPGLLPWQRDMIRRVLQDQEDET